MKNNLVIGIVVIVILIVGGLFAFQSHLDFPSNDSKIGEKGGSPVLQGLGVNFPEDFVFSKDVLFDDGFIKNEVFTIKKIGFLLAV